MEELSHLDAEGRARMVDVGGKPQQLRLARASGRISMAPATIEQIRRERMKKGQVLTVAEIAGVAAAKRTAELIPLCHSLPLTHVGVKAELEENGVKVTAEASCIGRTGVEMEALTATAVALLTLYDMCKAVDKKMIITGIKLLEKTKSDIANKRES
jgi:cyclic pyranopterin monophosphate synthase